jgi:hypothetical protein
MPSIAQAQTTYMEDVVAPNQNQNPLKRRREDKLVRWVVLVSCAFLALCFLIGREDGGDMFWNY